MKYLRVFMAGFVLFFYGSASADGEDLAELVAIYKVVNQSLTQLQSQVEKLKSLQGNYGWGNKDFSDFGSWNDASEWNNVLNLAGKGGSNGKLGQKIKSLSDQFPIDTETFNKAVTSKTDQKYYELKAKTALAARAASQLDFDNLQKQIDNQKQLQQQIDHTANIKSAVDLQNRLQVENNLINLELLREVSLLNEQQAVELQEDINAAYKNARF